MDPGKFLLWLVIFITVIWTLLYWTTPRFILSHKGKIEQPRLLILAFVVSLPLTFLTYYFLSL